MSDSSRDGQMWATRPSATINMDFVLKLPLSAVCRERNLRLEGRFRYRLEHFESRKQARAYIKLMDSPDWQRARASFVVSEPFEIPPP